MNDGPLILSAAKQALEYWSWVEGSCRLRLENELGWDLGYEGAEVAKEVCGAFCFAAFGVWLW